MLCTVCVYCICVAQAIFVKANIPGSKYCSRIYLPYTRIQFFLSLFLFNRSRARFWSALLWCVTFDSAAWFECFIFVYFPVKSPLCFFCLRVLFDPKKCFHWHRHRRPQNAHSESEKNGEKKWRAQTHNYFIIIKMILPIFGFKFATL